MNIRFPPLYGCMLCVLVRFRHKIDLPIRNVRLDAAGFSKSWCLHGVTTQQPNIEVVFLNFSAMTQIACVYIVHSLCPRALFISCDNLS